MLVCAGTGCVASKSLAVKKALEAELVKRNLEDEVLVVATGCNGFCAAGPVMVVYPEGIFYQRLKPEDMAQLVEEHLLQGRPVERLMFTDPAKKKTIPRMHDISFFGLQELRALRNRGIIDAEKIDDYIARSGYFAVAPRVNGDVCRADHQRNKGVRPARAGRSRVFHRHEMGVRRESSGRHKIRAVQRR